MTSMPVETRCTRSTVSAMAPRCTPSAVVPCWMSLVALQRLRVVGHRARPVRARQHPRMHDAGQRGAVGRAAVVVSDVARDGVVLERIPEASEQRAQLVGGEEIEQHQHVGLLRGLVAVRAVMLRLEDEIEALDVAVPLAVVFPIELRELS